MLTNTQNWPVIPDNTHRFGFQGQEKDDEVTGITGSHLNFKFRMYDSRIGRFFAVDPLSSKYPHWTPYAFSGNRVIDAVELEGLEPINLHEKGSGDLYTEATLSQVGKGEVDIFAHGGPAGYIVYNSNGVKTRIETAEQLMQLLIDNNIDIANTKTIVLRSCYGAELAEKAAKSPLFEGITIVGPVSTYDNYRKKKNILYSTSFEPVLDENGNEIIENNKVKKQLKQGVWQVWKNKEKISERRIDGWETPLPAETPGSNNSTSKPKEKPNNENETEN